MDLSEFEIYKGKSFSSLCKEIVVNQNEKKDQLDILISELRSLIKNVNDAIILVPLIKEYLDVSVKNDDQLVKLAAVIQRIMARQNESSGEEGGSMFITDKEKEQLLKEVDDLRKYENPINVKIKDIQ